MLQNNCEMAILVKGKRIDEYQHMGQVFIEGRSNSEFEIEFINRNPFRVEAVISVDGLSILDGKPAGEQSSGYLVNAHSTVRIPGWRLTTDQVAKFVFAGKGQSYATQMSGSDINNGVIGVMVFREKSKPVVYRSYAAQPFGLQSPSGSIYTFGGTGDWSSTLRSHSVSNATLGGQNSAAMTASVKAADVAQAQVNNLGTGFGEAASFNTESVTFEREDLHVLMVMYYDDRRGLAARGIEVGRRKAPRQTTPQAFPAMTSGCQPPPGWRG